MQTQASSKVHKVENDPRLLFWFAIVLMVLVFIWTFFKKPELLKPGLLIPYTCLFAVYIFLHFRITWIEKHRRWLPGYVIGQGILAFTMTYLSANAAMVFCLYMALIGELLGIFKITLGGILASVYLLCLAFINFILMVGIRQAGWFGLATIPTVIFVGIYVILYTRQAEANERAQELLAKLEMANRQLSDYAAQVEDLTLAGERQRMARELHDTLSQGLAGLILQLEAVDAHLGSQRTERARLILRQSMEKARETLAEARQVIQNLRDSRQPDLEDALRKEADHFTVSTGIPCTVEIGLPPNLPEQTSEAIIRVVSEALTNIARHAQANRVTLRIASLEEQGKIDIEITDNGIGFELATVEAGHYGLLGMKERVRLAGGQMRVVSAPGKGTGIMIEFPLKEASEVELTRPAVEKGAPHD